MVTGPESGDQVIGLLGQAKELRAEPLLHFCCGFIGEREGHNLRHGQGVWLSQEEVEDSIDQDRSLAGPGSRHYHNITVPEGLRQEAILGVCECECLTHRVLSAFSTCVRLGPGAIDRSATKPSHPDVGRRRKTRSSRNSHREE